MIYVGYCEKKMGTRLCQIVVNIWIKSGNQIVLDCVFIVPPAHSPLTQSELLYEADTQSE